jgi:iron complex outermembrane receptor protein
MSELIRLPALSRAGLRVGVRVGLAALALGLTGALNATVSLAADEKATASGVTKDDSLVEIVVTARKRSENLRDIPASITAISAATIEDAHITQLDDLGALVSNLNIDEAHDNTPDVVLRGVGSFGLVAGVGFYVNDVQVFEGQIARPVDIERIEVLKGPVGTLFGGANVGGAIKYVTKDPTSTWENEATVELGSYSTRNYQAVVSGPLSDTVGIRASVYYDSHDGNVYDTVNKFDYGAANDHGARVTLVAAPNESNKIHVWLSADDYNTSSQNLMYEPPDAHTYSRTVQDFFIPSFVRHIGSAAVQLDHQMEANLALTSLTSYFTSYNRGFTDFFKQPVPIDLLQQDADNRVYSEELRLASTGGSDVDWLVGAFFQGHKSGTLATDNNYNADPNNPMLLPLTPNAPPGPTGFYTSTTPIDYDRSEKMQREYALFGDVTLHHGNWEYEAGLRGEYYTSSLSAVNTNNVANGDFTTPVLPIAPESISGHEFSPRVSAQYKFSPTANVYGAISRGFTPGDLVEENFIIHSFRPEIATQYEVGYKSLLEYGVQLNAAVFYTYYKDRLYLYQKLANGPILDLTANIGPSTNVGAEFDLAAPLPGGFKVSVGGGVLRARWGETSGFTNPGNGNIAPGTPQQLNGLNVPFAPAYTASTTLDWKHDFGGYLVGARTEASFIGRSYWDPQNSAFQEAYHLLNASAWLEHGKWKLTVAGTNLTDTSYNTVFWPVPDVNPFHNIARINRPRWFTVNATVRF